MPSTLLGYDWAAAVDDDSRRIGSRAFLKEQDEQLSALSSFRRLHPSSCVGPSNLGDLDSEIRGLNPKVDIGAENWEAEDEEEETKRRLDPKSHICVFPYEIEERLFARPLTTVKVRYL